MATITHHGHGVFCHVCQAVYEDTDGCEHNFDRKDGIRKDDDGYITDPDGMGHYSPCMFMEIDELEQCVECGATKLPAEMVEAAKA
jgi:rubredoxin